MLVQQLRGRRTGVFQSGGLSSLALAVWLKEHGVPAHQYVADIGQCSRAETDKLLDTLRAAGMPASLVNLRAAMADMAEALLRYRARHDGGYWNTAGASRYVLTANLLGRMVADGRQIAAHGCVGGGNDQRRFAGYTERFAPGTPVYESWQDPEAVTRFPDRQAMMEAVAGERLWLDPGSDADRSTDANLAGVSHESGELELLETPVTRLEPRWSSWPHEAPAHAQEIDVSIVDGRIADVDGSGPRPLDWLSSANEIGGRHGCWLRDVVERRVIGTVCRGVYEAPGLELLDHAWSKALQICLDPDSQRLFGELSRVVGRAVYEGRYDDLSAQAARSGIDELVEAVTARVRLRAHRGTVLVTALTAAGGTRRQTRFDMGGHRWS